MQADCVLKTDNGDIWYSEEYIQHQIELAFQAGISVGARVEIHLMQPLSKECLPDYTNEFWERINKEYTDKFDKGHVWRIAQKRKLYARN